MTHTITLTEQELLVIVNALQLAAAENRSNFAQGELYEKGNYALVDEAEEQEEIAATVSSCLTDILPDPRRLDDPCSLGLPAVGPFNF